MSQNERNRCLCCGRSDRNGERAYSEWHRASSISRWIDHKSAQKLYLSNIDASIWIECHDYMEPIALIETAQDFGQAKHNYAIENLARLCTERTIEAYVCLYKLGNNIDLVTGEAELVSFRLRRIWPDKTEYYVLTPKEYANFLKRLRIRGIDHLLEYRKTNHGDVPYCHDLPRMKKSLESKSLIFAPSPQDDDQLNLGL